MAGDFGELVDVLLWLWICMLIELFSYLGWSLMARGERDFQREIGL